MLGSRHPIFALLTIMDRLRDPDTGCPWDREQDFASIAPYTIEEAYEVADAIARDDRSALREELGDLLFQVVFHARIAADAGEFDFADVAQSVADKMIRRHPHVFGSTAIETAADQEQAWEMMKATERGGGAASSALAGVALGLPALMRAQKIQKRAAHVGFDWPDPHGARAKIDEELDELAAATTADHRVEEFGDFLFAAVNYGRKLGIDTESALRAATAKFERRFTAVERRVGGDASAFDLERLEKEWRAVKAGEAR